MDTVTKGSRLCAGHLQVVGVRGGLASELLPHLVLELGLEGLQLLAVPQLGLSLLAGQLRGEPLLQHPVQLPALPLQRRAELLLLHRLTRAGRGQGQSGQPVTGH